MFILFERSEDEKILQRKETSKKKRKLSLWGGQNATTGCEISELLFSKKSYTSYSTPITKTKVFCKRCFYFSPTVIDSKGLTFKNDRTSRIVQQQKKKPSVKERSSRTENKNQLFFLLLFLKTFATIIHMWEYDIHTHTCPQSHIHVQHTYMCNI